MINSSDHRTSSFRRHALLATAGIGLLNNMLPLNASDKIPVKDPNFIFILADNLGYGDLGCFGSVKHRTPNVDAMAREGIKLTTFYSSSGVSTPSRASLMTGCYAQRVDMHLNDKGGWVLFPGSSKGLNPRETTIPEILKKKGYVTACIGKWHMGDQPELLPMNHGFDYFFGLPYSEDMVPSKTNPGWPELPLMKNDKVIKAPADLTATTRQYVEEAVKFIKENKSKPFFLYLPHNLPGSRAVPVVGEDFSGKSGNGSYGDSVEELDWAVGQVISAVKELDLESGTLIVFVSDNGSPRGRAGSNGAGSNEPLSGAGYSTMEGGMRVPCIVKWKGVIQEGTTSDELCTMMDWLPTFAQLSGTEVSKERKIDGKNIWPVISGDPQAKSPHKLFFYYLMDQLQAVRDTRWKLILPLNNRYEGGDKKRFYGKSELMLIDLKNDISEKTDVSSQHPEIVKKLMKAAEGIRKELGDTDKPGSMIRPALYVREPEYLKMDN
jgi:arylsulfatase A